MLEGKFIRKKLFTCGATSVEKDGVHLSLGQVSETTKFYLVLLARKKKLKMILNYLVVSEIKGYLGNGPSD